MVNTKIIIVGQDPYPNRKYATGFAFSVPDGEKIPPSLKNIFKELKNDLKLPIPSTGNLSSWQDQGVMLLNPILTTVEGKSGAHRGYGWETMIATKIQQRVDIEKPLVMIAWGKDAQKFVKRLKLNQSVFVLEGGHPSPLNRKNNFFGGKYFSKANQWLIAHGLKPINWEI
jgi:uracil-DNA glycosylase